MLVLLARGGSAPLAEVVPEKGGVQTAATDVFDAVIGAEDLTDLVGQETPRFWMPTMAVQGKVLVVSTNWQTSRSKVTLSCLPDIISFCIHALF